MKTYNLKIIEAEKVLSENEQKEFRARLKHLLKVVGIISMCLDSEYLFVEYDVKNISSQNLELLFFKSGFPVKQEIKLAS